MKPSLKTLPHSHTALPGGVLHAWPLRRTLLVAGLVGTAATALALWLPLWIGLVLAVVVLTAGLVWRRPVVLVLTLTAAVYLLLGVGYRHLVVAPLEQLAGQRVTLSGQVTQSSSTATVTLEVTHSDRLPRGTRLALYCPGDALALFDTVTVEADLEPIPDHAGSWRRLDTPGGDLLFGTDPAAPYPDSRAAVTVYASGLPPSLPPDTLPLAVEPNQQITLTTRHGKEWSVWKWP